MNDGIQIIKCSDGVVDFIDSTRFEGSVWAEPLKFRGVHTFQVTEWPASCGELKIDAKFSLISYYRTRPWGAVERVSTVMPRVTGDPLTELMEHITLQNIPKEKSNG